MTTTTKRKPYKGMPMEGPIAWWYARNTRGDRKRFAASADLVTARTPAGGRVLEVAPGPGYLSMELAARGFDVTGVDISESFVGIARRNAARAGVRARFVHGEAARLPLPDDAFDFAVCTAAFKNFTDPVGALNELHRVLRPGGKASIQDLRKDATLPEIRREVEGMHLSRVNAALTLWIFRKLLLRTAYTRDAMVEIVRRSRFGTGELVDAGIGFDLRLEKRA